MPLILLALFFFKKKKLAVTACPDDLVEGLPEAVASLAGLRVKAAQWGGFRCRCRGIVQRRWSR